NIGVDIRVICSLRIALRIGREVSCNKKASIEVFLNWFI
ncbi:MAG: hypothetical protein ACI8XV_002534, partial [Arenicella sp.]